MSADLDALAAPIRADIAALAGADPTFATALRVAGNQPILLRPPGFSSLIKLILEQQVSLAAAARMYVNLCAACDPLEPVGFLTLDETLLRSCGFSRQKIKYARGLAEALTDGSLDLGKLAGQSDDRAVETLCRLKGIGPWTAQNYLLWSHGRRDIFPANDLALMIGWQWLADIEARPSADQLTEIALAWRPKRTAAAFLIWNFYLSEVDSRRAARKAVATQPASV